ncbi:PREDICTED: beta-galactosidase [Rhagoletis zephyria]|uniref:beta-galactosidase n=1 Tax=Rhagoletis zephyria TaxID=28612 RepID=UPI000811791A|nr:PREDICTED: beta-galactosidase [Rhagoletis zephyria]
MSALKNKLVTRLILVCLLVSLDSCWAKHSNRTFTIDHEANTFLMDGKPFRYVSGSFHYFRALPQVWEERLKTMQAAGLNAIDTYIEWSLHNPRDGVYNWEGIADIERFLELAQNAGFYVILRPGPYICAERDNGGLPHWLFTKYPGIKMRTSDPNYQLEVSKWYAQLMPRMQKFFYGNGGPIITVQVENEYGAFYACDTKHLIWLRDQTEKYVKGKAVLFTTDQPNDGLKCGKIEGVYATIDFGIGSNFDDQWKAMRSVQPTGPLVNSEFYPGWLTHWEEENQRRNANEVANSLSRLQLLVENQGRINYETLNDTKGILGAITVEHLNGEKQELKDWVTTSFPLESEQITTLVNAYKHQMITELASKSNVLRNGPVVYYGEFEVEKLGDTYLNPLGWGKGVAYINGFNLGRYWPLVGPQLTLYLPKDLLRIGGNTLVLLEYQKANLNRESGEYQLGSRLQLLVENQGRINYETLNDTKGILGAITVEHLNGEKQELKDWVTTSFPLESEQITTLVNAYKHQMITELASKSNVLRNGPVVYYGEFEVEKLGDTYLNPLGWGKGVAYINGFNLGRYWPLVGPQLTLYLPKDLLRIGGNTLVLLEYQKANLNRESGEYQVTLDDRPQLDG